MPHKNQNKMSIKDIIPPESEKDSLEPYTPEYRLKEVVAEISLKFQDELKERVFSHLSDEEIRLLLEEKDEELFTHETSFAKMAQYELWKRKTLARAIEVGGDGYCCHCDCALKDCPD
jgi:hypothetical protein